ncbi:hypothetical protein B0I35DRAFT_207682 [Stachybotrys elegans]|uniref:Uncharacterized protein n=1 Tax=Stachybotrys elegans TaxID=80388 RepID=A0A8K0SXW0_9HYPO|nr:hypothetical protein B0I35DRAFT_207682 [Stachybotrys elegans]
MVPSRSTNRPAQAPHDHLCRIESRATMALETGICSIESGGGGGWYQEAKAGPWPPTPLDRIARTIDSEIDWARYSQDTVQIPWTGCKEKQKCPCSAGKRRAAAKNSTRRKRRWAVTVSFRPWPAFPPTRPSPRPPSAQGSFVFLAYEVPRQRCNTETENATENNVIFVFPFLHCRASSRLVFRIYLRMVKSIRRRCMFVMPCKMTTRKGNKAKKTT